MKQKPREGWMDLAPGVAAAIAFLVMFGLTLPTWLCILLAISVYVGVQWLLPSPKAVEESAPPTIAQLTQELGGLAGQIADPALRRKIEFLVTQAAELERYFQASPEKSEDSLFVVRQFLELTRVGVRRYIEAGRFARTPQRESARMLNELLDSVSDRFASLQRKINADNDADLAGELKALNQTLQELDKVVSLQVGEKQE